MKKNVLQRKRMPGRILAAALALLFCLTGAAAGEKAVSLAPADADMILARETVEKLALKGSDGNPLQVRYDAAAPGRGAADAEGKAPDYTGMVGFAALPNDPMISRFSIFDKAYWTVPVYDPEAKGCVPFGSLSHKSTVLVTGQEERTDDEGKVRQLLNIIRLDLGTACLLEAGCFVTLPYWNLTLREATEYGYCLAVYRETPGEPPKTEDGKSFALRDGTRVLILFREAAGDRNPEPDKLPVAGVVFREGKGDVIEPVTVFFRENELTLNY